MHQRVPIIAINSHAGQAGKVVVQHPGFLLGLIRADPGQPLGHVASAAAHRVTLHLNGADGARLRVDLDLKVGPPK